MNMCYSLLCSSGCNGKQMYEKKNGVTHLPRSFHVYEFVSSHNAHHCNEKDLRIKV